MVFLRGKNNNNVLIHRTALFNDWNYQHDDDDDVVDDDDEDVDDDEDGMVFSGQLAHNVRCGFDEYMDSSENLKNYTREKSE